MKFRSFAILFICLNLWGANIYGATTTSTISGNSAASDLHLPLEILLTIFTVTNTNNSGAGSLRQAILDANANPGLDVIRFNIPGVGPHTINVTSALPGISEPVQIDGTSEPDFAGSPVIELNGTGTGSTIDGLVLAPGSDSSVIRGLVINRFGRDGISGSANNVLIVGNYMGTDVSGTLDLGNKQDGIQANGNNWTIGGTSAADRNLVSGNNDDGIQLFGDGNIVLGNYIGTNAAGSAAIGNTDDGVEVASTSTGNTIGGTAIGARNVISGNGGEGVLINITNSNQVLGNYIGVDATGNLDLGNVGSGVKIMAGANSNTIGGPTPEAMNVISGNNTFGICFDNGDNNTVQGNRIGSNAAGTAGIANSQQGILIVNGSNGNLIGGTISGEGNLLAYNTLDGVAITGGTGNTILGNTFHSNGDSGIDLLDDGLTANDAGDTDNGPNNLQNFPVLTAASANVTQVTITGTLNSTPDSYFRVEFFSSTTADVTGYGEGQRYLGSANMMTDGSGNATFNTTLTETVTAGEFVSATANKSNADFTAFTDASEFAQCVIVCNSIVIERVITDVSCNSGSDGAIDITVSGGTSPYTYDWADLAGTNDPEDRTSLAAGNYTVTVKDAETCSTVEEFAVNQPYTLTISKTHPFAALNITAPINDPNPFPSFTFTGGWSLRFPETQGTTYNYTSTFDNAYIPAGYTLDPDWLGNSLISYTKNDPSATSDAFHTGASRVTEYHDFNPGDLVNASEDIYHVYGRGHFGFNSAAVGSHDWTITIDFSTLTNGYLPSGTLIGFSDIDGINALNENVLLTATGTGNQWLTIFDFTSELPTHGTALYNAPGKPDNSYYFDGPSVSNAAIAYVTSQNLSSITVRGKSAQGGGAFGIKFAAPLSPFVEQNVSCNGGDDGKTTIAVAGGTEPYNYLWSNGETTQSITGLTAGIYSLLVTDGNLCTDTVSQIITQPALPLAATITNLTHLICFGDTTGSVTVEATVGTGTAPYQYSIDGVNFGSSGTFGSLLAGSYTATVKDTNNCTYNVPVTITQPNNLTATLSGSTSICAGDSATIAVQLSGGTQPWKVTWAGGSNLNVNGTDPYNFTYNTGALASTTTYNSDDITVTDANVCASTINGTVTVTVNAAVDTPIFTMGSTTARCKEAGSVTYTATAANTTGITYTLDAASITGGNSIDAGTGTVTYAAGWSGTSIITASAEGCNGPKITTHSVVISDTINPVVTCPLDRTESLNDNCEFIIPDYTTLASVTDNCDPTPSITQSPAMGIVLIGSGTIQEIVLTARDQAGNESTCSFNITLMDNTPPETISLNDTSVMVQEGRFETSIDIPLPLFADNCGVISVSNDFNGGTDASGIYQYGTTTVVYTVTDINYNTATFNQRVVVGLENEPAHGLVIPQAFSPNEDGLNDRFEILGIEQYPENELQIYNVHGIEVFTMGNYDNSWDGTAMDMLNDGNKLPSGTYYYILNLNLGNSLVKGFIYLRRE